MTKGNGKTDDEVRTIKDCVRRLDALRERKEIAKRIYADARKEIAEDVHQVFHEAKALGLIPRALKTVMVTKILRENIDKAVDALDPDAHAAYEIYLKAASAWTETPLGRAASEIEEEVEML